MKRPYLRNAYLRPENRRKWPYCVKEQCRACKQNVLIYCNRFVNFIQNALRLLFSEIFERQKNISVHKSGRCRRSNVADITSRIIADKHNINGTVNADSLKPVAKHPCDVRGKHAVLVGSSVQHTRKCYKYFYGSGKE